MSNGTTTWSFTYNADGLRTQKTNGVKTYTYVYSGSNLSQMTVDNDTLHFFYDDSGIPVSVEYNNATYYYTINIQGDVTAILDTTGTAVVKYTYDAWGKPLSIEGDSANTLGTINPLRYRGYIYDQETEQYYLQSRFYNPEICRFINADAFPSTGQGFSGNNMFAYCGNNPVNRADSVGCFWDMVFDIASLVISVVEVVKNPSDVGAWVGLALDVVDVALPVVSGLGEAADAVNAGRKVAEAADKLNDAGKVAEATTKSARSSAVRKAWKNEVQQVIQTGKGSRDWTVQQMNELISTGKVKGYYGHHMKSVKGYPELAGDPNNIQFLTRQEHLLAHGGNWRNITHGRYIP